MGFWDSETIDSQQGTRYYRRINVESSCLACHGCKNARPQFVKDKYPQDLAFDFNVGDLRGMYSVFIPYLQGE
jgi:phage gp36-like protein